MGNSRRTRKVNSKRKFQGNKKKISRFIKFLTVAPNKKVLSTVLQSAPDEVIKSISNAALNAMRGDVSLNSNQKRLFANKRQLFNKLVSPKINIKQKKRILVQKGGVFPIIPILIGTVLGSLGSHFLAGSRINPFSSG